MAHELTLKNGRAEMAYVGDTPWHGLGQALTAGASIDDWLEAAGMNWTIQRAPVQFQPPRTGAERRTWNDRHVLYRSDDHSPLGLVSPSYIVVQPFEMLEFFRDLVSDNGFELETAGTLFGGARFWALARVAKAQLAGWDDIGGYILLSSTADGSRATECRETTVRVVCNNTLSMALNANAKRRLTVAHNTHFDHAVVKKSMGLSRENFAAFMEAANSLTKVKVSSIAAEAFVSALLNKVDLAEGALRAGETEDRRPRGFDKILSLFNGAGKGADQKGSKGTAWGLVNAVTQYVDWDSVSKSPDHRIEKAWWGAGDLTKTRALELAQQL